VASPDADRRLREVEADLERIEQALRRLDDGTYGACNLCGARLPQDVLDADPLTERCPS
jgi:RNA polymerase-binding transcription factor DksA